MIFQMSRSHCSRLYGDQGPRPFCTARVNDVIGYPTLVDGRNAMSPHGTNQIPWAFLWSTSRLGSILEHTPLS